MNFTYEASGGIKLIGCAVTSMARQIYVRFREGDVAYEKWKAQSRGLVRKVVIKFVDVYTTQKYQSELFVRYTDTLNGIWMDAELVTHSEALALAEAYLTKQALLAEALLEKGC